MTNAGAVARPVFLMSVVATSGAVPLNAGNARFKPSATTLKRTRVGKRSVRITANVPLTRLAQRPARIINTVGSSAREASAEYHGKASAASAIDPTRISTRGGTVTTRRPTARIAI